MDKFLETYNLPKLNQEESQNLNRQITPTKFEAVIKQPPKYKSIGPDSFTGEFYQKFCEELTLLLLKLFKKFKKREGSQAQFMKPVLSYMTEYYSAVKKKKILTFATVWMDLEYIMLSEISQSEKDKNHLISLRCGI